MITKNVESKFKIAHVIIEFVNFSGKFLWILGFIVLLWPGPEAYKTKCLFQARWLGLYKSNGYLFLAHLYNQNIVCDLIIYLVLLLPWLHMYIIFSFVLCQLVYMLFID